MNEDAALLIIEYMENYLFEPRKNWPAYWFEQRSFQRWAANEILELIMDHPLDSPDLIIDGFQLKMILFSCMTQSTKASQIFSIARETAESILFKLEENLFI